MANKNYQTARFSAGQRFTIVILSFVLMLAIFAGVIYAVTVNSNDKIGAGTYTQGDDTIMFLDEPLPPIEPSNLTAVVVEEYNIFELQQQQQGQGVTDIEAFSLEIAPMSSPADLGLTVTTDPSSLSTSGMTPSFLNGIGILSAKTVDLDRDTGFEIRIDRYPNDMYSDERVVIKIAGTWYATPLPNNSEPTDIYYDFSSLDTGTYELCVTGTFTTPRRTHIVTINYTATKYEPLPVAPNREGYTFVGWYFDEALTQKVTELVVEENTVLYAKYEINKYLVSFVTNFGSAINSVTVDYNTTVNLSSYTTVRTGYDFKGWYKDSALTQAAGASIVIKSDTELFAKFELKILNIVLMVDGEVWKTINVTYGTTITSIVTEIEETSFNLKSMTTNGIVYDDVADESVFIGDTLMTLETKTLSDQIADIDWAEIFMWGGISLAGAVVLIGTILLIISASKKKSSIKAPKKKGRK